MIQIGIVIMSRNKKVRPARIRSVQEKTGKRRRGAANVVGRNGHGVASRSDAESQGLFEELGAAIAAAHMDASITLAKADCRLEVAFGRYSFALLTPRGEEPAWPVVLFNETGSSPLSPRHAWECQNIEDVLTVLRWPEAAPARAYASANQLRDEQENPAKHVWVPGGGNILERVFCCTGCAAHLRVKVTEKVDEIARMAFDNWRERQARMRRGRPSTITRSMEVGAIPPHCPKDALQVEDVLEPEPSVPSAYDGSAAFDPYAFVYDVDPYAGADTCDPYAAVDAFDPYAGVDAFDAYASVGPSKGE